MNLNQLKCIRYSVGASYMSTLLNTEHCLNQSDSKEALKESAS